MKKVTQITTIIVAGLIFSFGQNKAEDSSHDHKEHAGEKPVKHLELPDVTTAEEASKVMDGTTAQLKSKEKFDAADMGSIHIITYSLEKAVAYYAEKGTAEQKPVAEKMAIVVEEIHLNSENNRVEETKKALKEYFTLAEGFKK